MGPVGSRAFREVIIPLAVPGLATTAILTFVYSWNEFLFALSFTLGPEHRRFRWPSRYSEDNTGSLGTDPCRCGNRDAASDVLVLAFQRRIVQGLTAGAVKG